MSKKIINDKTIPDFTWFCLFFQHKRCRPTKIYNLYEKYFSFSSHPLPSPPPHIQILVFNLNQEILTFNKTVGRTSSPRKELELLDFRLVISDLELSVLYYVHIAKKPQIYKIVKISRKMYHSRIRGHWPLKDVHRPVTRGT